MKKVIIDLTEPAYGKLPQHYAYSALSRATSLDSILILRPFRLKVIQESPHIDMLEELDRLEKIETTTLSYINSIRN